MSESIFLKKKVKLLIADLKRPIFADEDDDEFVLKNKNF